MDYLNHKIHKLGLRVDLRIKITLYRANFFEDEGTVSFFNPELTEQTSSKTGCKLEFSSKKIRVSLDQLYKILV